MWNLLAKWFSLTVVLGLMQVWVVLIFRWSRQEPLELHALLLKGGLIFYANAIAMNVLYDRIAALPLLLGKVKLGARARMEIAGELVLPLTVITHRVFHKHPRVYVKRERSAGTF